MKPVRIAARNYRTWAELDLTVRDGLTAIVGDNGAGKSSIVNVVELALFGGSLSAHHNGSNELMTLELQFEHRGGAYRIRRSYEAKGRGKSTLDFDQAWDLSGDEPSDWRPLTAQSIADTQKQIEQLLGLSKETFRASAFLAQGDAAAFTNATPANRKAVLAEILDLEVWDRLLARCRGEIAVAQRSAEIDRAKLEGIEQELAASADTDTLLHELENGLRATEHDLHVVEMELADVAEQYRAARDAQAELAAARAEQAGLQLAVDRLAEQERKAKDAEQQIRAVSAEHARHMQVANQLPTREDELAELRAAYAAAKPLINAKFQPVTAGLLTSALQLLDRMIDLSHAEIA